MLPENMSLWVVVDQLFLSVLHVNYWHRMILENTVLLNSRTMFPSVEFKLVFSSLPLGSKDAGLKLSKISLTF